MVQIQEITDAAQWDQVVLANHGHPLQLWGWGEVKSGFDWSAKRYVARDSSGNFLAAAQVLVRKLPWPFRALAYVPRGPVVAEENSDSIQQFLDALTTTVKQDVPSVMGLSIEPDGETWPEISGWKPTDQEILPSLTIRLDLTDSAEELQKKMPKKTRQYIRKSARELGEIRVGSVEDLDECFRIYEDTAERAEFALRSREYYRRVWDMMGSANRLYIASFEGKPVAFLWNALSDEVAFELYGGMDAEGQRLRANYALKWFAIEDAKQHSATIYDMGGLIGGGVSKFKQAWTDEASQLSGTLEYKLSWRLGVWNTVLPWAKSLLKRFR